MEWTPGHVINISIEKVEWSVFNIKSDLQVIVSMESEICDEIHGIHNQLKMHINNP